MAKALRANSAAIPWPSFHVMTDWRWCLGTGTHHLGLCQSLTVVAKTLSVRASGGMITRRVPAVAYPNVVQGVGCSSPCYAMPHKEVSSFNPARQLFDNIAAVTVPRKTASVYSSFNHCRKTNGAYGSSPGLWISLRSAAPRDRHLHEAPSFKRR